MDINKRIAALEKELKELKAELNKPYEIEFERDNTWCIDGDSVMGDYAGNMPGYLKHGRYRKTQQGAELSAKRNIRANRLEMLVESLGGLKEFKEGEDNFSIFYDYHANRWIAGISTSYRRDEVVYITTAEITDKVCELLNSGRYTL
jgi:hypothetical protein